MDPELVKEQASFRKRALETPAIETKKPKRTDSPSSDGGNTPKSKISTPPPRWSNEAIGSPRWNNEAIGSPRYKGLVGVGAGSSFKFGVLTKIVMHLKLKLQEGVEEPFTLEDLLDQTQQLDASEKTRQWLRTEALPNNPKVEITSDSRYQFKAPLPCRDKRSLLRLLKQHDMKGLGGIMRDDVVESVANAEKVLMSIESEVITITRQDKRKVLYYNDNQADLEVAEQFKMLWNAVPMNGMDDVKIAEYLDKQGITSMQDGPKKLKPPVRRRQQRKKQHKQPKDNEHVAADLKHYDSTI